MWVQDAMTEVAYHGSSISNYMPTESIPKRMGRRGVTGSIVSYSNGRLPERRKRLIEADVCAFSGTAKIAKCAGSFVSLCIHGLMSTFFSTGQPQRSRMLPVLIAG